MSYSTSPPLAAGDITKTLLASGSVDKTKLHTGGGEYDQSFSTSGSRQVAMHDYSFFPNLSTNGIMAGKLTYKINSLQTSANYTASMGFESFAGATYRYNFWWRYLTATDKPFIQFGIDAGADYPSGLWAADDPPNHLWGLDELPEPEAAPMLSYETDTGLIIPNEDICIFNYPLDHWKALKEKCKTDKKRLFDLLKSDYEIDKQALKSLAKGKEIKAKNLGEI